MTRNKPWLSNFDKQQHTIIAASRQYVTNGSLPEHEFMIIIAQFADLLDACTALTEMLRHALQEENAK